jgi:DNA-binding NtrC family response regulator
MNIATLLGGEPRVCQCDPVALVVEDEVLIRMALVETLMDDGYEVIEAASVDEAHFILGCRSDISLIVTDVETSGTTNGFMLARRMVKQRPDVRMIVVSGRSAPKPGELPEGVSFIAKPFRAETLLFVANRMVERLSRAA